jgi:hypothetical protein
LIFEAALPKAALRNLGMNTDHPKKITTDSTDRNTDGSKQTVDLHPPPFFSRIFAPFAVSLFTYPRPLFPLCAFRAFAVKILIFPPFGNFAVKNSFSNDLFIRNSLFCPWGLCGPWLKMKRENR